MRHPQRPRRGPAGPAGGRRRHQAHHAERFGFANVEFLEGVRRVPEALRNDPVLYGECLSGALHRDDFQRLARPAGFADPGRAAPTGALRFFTATFRKVPGSRHYGVFEGRGALMPFHRAASSTPARPAPPPPAGG